MFDVPTSLLQTLNSEHIKTIIILVHEKSKLVAANP
jgi:hypothetical protein